MEFPKYFQNITITYFDFLFKRDVGLAIHDFLMQLWIVKDSNLNNMCFSLHFIIISLPNKLSIGRANYYFLNKFGGKNIEF